MGSGAKRLFMNALMETVSQLISKLSSSSLTLLYAITGVYFAQYGSMSIDSYSRPRGLTWPKSDIQVSACVPLAEIVNLPQMFRSSPPFFVVQQTEWILW